MKKPNYAEMKEMLAQRESESISQRELHEILLFGTMGWDSWDNDDILDQFISVFGEHQIPKKEAK
jgi:hypothetical protein|tara:strand:- start:491 stop:685 length:195 start_codon:yes stop_codon:yes gene_type:complete